MNPIEAAIESLRDHSWALHTCDAGYRCQIYKAPECGEELLADGVAETIEGAIKLAVKRASEIKA